MRHIFRGCVAIAAVLFLLGGLVYAYQRVNGFVNKIVPAQAERDNDEARNDRETEQAPLDQAPLDQPPLDQPSFPAQAAKKMIHGLAQPSRPPAASSPSAARSSSPPSTLSQRVNAAIAHGVSYLRKRHSLPYEYQNYLGLLGLTFLECGIPANDPSVQQIAAWMRARERQMTNTYELALAILFLDRLGEPRDSGLIQRYGQRLLQGQLEGGTWTYSCLNGLKRPNQGLRGMPTITVEGKMPQMPTINGNGGLSPNGNRNGRARVTHFGGDNSNTQFAILGLWVAQRHGVAARQALLATEQYFRVTQQDDGSWAYNALITQWPDAMTCAGLISLAMRHGVISNQGRDIRAREPVHVNDAAVMRGLQYLGTAMDRIGAAPDRIMGVEARDPLYFLWSLERLAVIYDLKTIGEHEWYPWSAELLLEVQRLDGSWLAPYPSPVGTCFALLILRRSNFVQDLQLAVQQPPSPGLIARPRNPSALPGTARSPSTAPPIGPGTAQTPNAESEIKKPDPSAGVVEIPIRKN